MTYDPSTNPRHLAPVVEDPDWEEQRSLAEERMQRIIDACNAQMSMFNAQGWAYLTSYMQQEMEAARQALLNPKAGQTMEDIQLIRGQLMAWERLLNIPELVRQQRDFYIEQTKQYRSTQ